MEKVKVIIPESWHDVSLGKYIDFIKLSNKYKNLDNHSAFLKGLIEIFYDNLTEDQIDSLEEHQLQSLTETLTFLNTQPTNDLKKEIELEGEKYLYSKETSKLTMGEMISFETILQSEDFEPIDTYPLILAIVLKKEGEEFDADLIYERMELFKKISISEAHGLIFFFLIGEKAYSPSLAVCLNNLAEMMKKETLIQKMMNPTV